MTSQKKVYFSCISVSKSALNTSERCILSLENIWEKPLNESSRQTTTQKCTIESVSMASSFFSQLPLIYVCSSECKKMGGCMQIWGRFYVPDGIVNCCIKNNTLLIKGQSISYWFTIGELKTWFWFEIWKNCNHE